MKMMTKKGLEEKATRRAERDRISRLASSAV